MSDSQPGQTGAVEISLKSEIKLYYDLHTPAVSPAPLLIALHGYGANKKQMMREALAMAPDGFAIVSLQGFHQHMKEPKEPGGPLRFGFGWLTNFHPEDSVAVHHQALLDIVNKLVNEGVVDRERVFLVGFSQTCALNYRFAFSHSDVLRGVIGICGGIPGDWETSEAYSPTTAPLFHWRERVTNCIRLHGWLTMPSAYACALRMLSLRVMTPRMRLCLRCARTSGSG